MLRRHHDMGGLDAGPVDPFGPGAEHDYAPWEKKVDAILRLVSDQKRQIMTVDELRRGIEELGPGVYDELSYYERWIASVTNILIEKGVIEIEELGRRMAEITDAWPAGGVAEAEPKTAGDLS
ncbi:SH3-like domain-containing protein [Pelagibius sp.]|uniref:SH3-like domain-containing protein n=1 Tax=Pelagibius sp. TaxID=1931238 RepID=UPI00262B38AB|nr:SH3-like domain-containing protein [Pelagibius sp.]